MHAARLGLLSGLALLTVAAAAQDGPPPTPTRDFSVTYLMTGGRDQARPPGGDPAEMRAFWLNAEQKLRMEMPGATISFLLDLRAHRMFVVVEQMRLAKEVPVPPDIPGFAIPPNARFVQSGSAIVAGQPCTVWRYEEGEDRGEACITTDGVPLRHHGTRNGRSSSMEATQVAYDAQDPARFSPPEGYMPMARPGGEDRLPGR